MKRLAVSLAIALALCAALAAPAMAEFGLKDLDVTFTDKFGEPTTQAGSHPFEMTTTLGVNTIELPPSSESPGGSEIPDGEMRNLTIEQIPGLAGTPTRPPLPDRDLHRKGRSRRQVLLSGQHRGRLRVPEDRLPAVASDRNQNPPRARVQSGAAAGSGGETRLPRPGNPGHDRRRAQLEAPPTTSSPR